MLEKRSLTEPGASAARPSDMKPLRLLIGLLSLSLPAAWGSLTPPLSLEEVCAEADLIVVGVLGPARVCPGTEGNSRLEMTLAAREPL